MKHRRRPGLVRLWTPPCGTWDTSPLPARSSKPRGQECGEGQGTWWLPCPWQLPAHTQPLPTSTAHLGSFRRWALPCQATGCVWKPSHLSPSSLGQLAYLPAHSGMEIPACLSSRKLSWSHWPWDTPPCWLLPPSRSQSPGCPGSHCWSEQPAVAGPKGDPRACWSTKGSQSELRDCLWSPHAGPLQAGEQRGACLLGDGRSLGGLAACVLGSLGP